MPNYREITNMIREHCNIKINDDNDNKFVLSKEEQIIVLAVLTNQRANIEKTKRHEQVVADVCKEVIAELKKEGTI